jgi:hypothetical protein
VIAAAVTVDRAVAVNVARVDLAVARVDLAVARVDLAVAGLSSCGR